MAIRWVPLSLLGHRIGAPFEAATKQQAYDLACARHGVLCERVQSLVSWQAEEEERQAEERNRRLYPRGTGEDR